MTDPYTHLSVSGSIKQRIARQLLSPTVFEFVQRTRWRMAWGLSAFVRRTFTRRGRDNYAALLAYRDLHRGQRCVIIGNGPSLNRTDLKLLSGETVFGLNRIYLMFDKLPSLPTYHVAVDHLILEQCVDEFNELTIPFFVSHRNFESDAERDAIYFLDAIVGPKFSTNAAHGIWEGGTVTFVALQLAYFMGFDEVILIGVDHNFPDPKRAGVTVQTTGEDPYHFSPNYHGAGFRWNLPDVAMVENAYRYAKIAFESDGRRIVDATVDGRLDIFDKGNLEDLLADR